MSRIFLLVLAPIALIQLPLASTAWAGCAMPFSASPARADSVLVPPQLAPPSAEPALQSLDVAANGRHLITADGRPFFWLGDTAWLLSQKTTRDDVELYLSHRARQGFTVIQAAAVMSAERGGGGTLVPNAYGDQAFVAGDPSRPQVTPGNDPGSAEEYDYWDHVDFIVERAEAHGLRLALLPFFVGFTGDAYRYLTPERAYAYGAFLGGRYGGQPHVIWVLGGDNSPDTEVKQSIWHDVARAVTVTAVGVEDYTRTLMTYHINGNFSSSQWFHTAPWLDFNMVQVWGDLPLIYSRVTNDYAMVPAKPTGLAEGSYEDGPQYFSKPIDALKIRQQAYWSYLAGGYHTYGNTNTWNFGSFTAEVTQDWRRALDAPGALHLSALTRIFASLPWHTLAPHPALLASGPGSDAERRVAARSDDGALGVIYMASGGVATIDLQQLAQARTVRAMWIDPQTGAPVPIGDVSPGSFSSFETPPGWQDALLLLEVVPTRR